MLLLTDTGTRFNLITGVNVTFRDVILSGEFLLWKDCPSGAEWCKHCLNSNLLLPGPATPIEAFNPDTLDTALQSKFQCANTQSSYFFLVAHKSASLTFDSCEIRQIRSRPTAVFLAFNSLLRFTNTAFYALATAQYPAAVVYFPESLSTLSNSYLRALPHSLLDRCLFIHCGQLVMENCTVQGVNRDHAYTKANDLESGFLFASNVQHIRLVNVHFSDNQLSASTHSEYGFFTLEETSLLEILSCTFDHCMGIVSVLYLSQGRTSALPGHYNEPQIIVQDSEFRGLFSQTDSAALTIHSSGLNPIVTLRNVLFDAGHSFRAAYVIWFDFNAEDHAGNFTYTSQDDATQQVFELTPGYIRFVNVTLRNSLISDENGSHIYITGAENVNFSGLTLDNNTYARGDTFTIFDHFAETGLHPLTAEIQSRFVFVENCMSVANLDNVSVISIWQSTVSNTQCDAGLEFVTPRNSASVQTVAFYGTIHGLLVSHTNHFSLVISDSEFFSNLGAALIQNFRKRQSISTNEATTVISNCYVHDNRDPEGRSGISYYGGNLTITNSRFVRNYGSANAGLYVFFLFSDPGMVARVAVQDSQFESNTVIGYFAADIDMESISKVNQSPEVVFISRCSFSHTQGGVITLNGLRLGLQTELSSIQDCSFLETQATVLGALHSTHISGELLVTRCSFLRCQGPSDDNCGISILSNTSTDSNPTLTRIEDSRFEQCSGSSCIEVDASSLQQSTVATSHCVFRDNTARAVENTGGYYSDQSSQFLNNSAEQGGAYFAAQSSSSIFINSVFAGNRAHQEAGAFDIVGPSSDALFLGCVIVNNSAIIKAGAGTLENNVNVLIQDSIIENNSAAAASAFFLADIDTFPVTLLNCSLQRNTGDLLIMSSQAYLRLNNTRISGNSKVHLSAGIQLLMSQLDTIDCVFDSLQGDTGCGVELLLESQWTDQRTTFKDSNCAGSVIDSQNSELNLTFTQFTGLAVTNLAVLNVYRYSHLTLTNAVFTDNIAAYENSSVLLCEDANLSIGSSVFRRTQGNIVHTISCPNIVITQSTFADSAGRGDAALSLLNPETVTIADSVFSDLSGVKAGGLYIRRDDSQGTLSMTGCTYQRCSGSSGGARLSGVYGNVTNSRFTGNTASGYGGGLYLNSSLGVHIVNCEFNSNQAVLGGGGFFWVEVTPTQSGSIYVNNSAAYGPDMGSDPHYMRLDSMSTSFLSNFPSGHVITSPVQFDLIDEMDQVVTTRTGLYAKIIADSKDVLVSGKIEARSMNGKLVFEDFALTATPGKDHQITIEADSTFVEDLNLTLQFRTCELGEILASKACSVCPQNTFSLDDNATICKPCPKGAECLGGMQLYPLEDYWRASPTSDILWPCFSSVACIGSDNTSSLVGLCAEGYSGQICQACKKDWARAGRDDCAQCPAFVLTMLRVIGLCIVGVVCLVFLVRSTMINIRTGRLTSVYYRIFLNYLQVTMLTTTFDLKWPDIAKQLFSTQDAVGGASEQFFSYDCLYYQIGYSDPVVFQDLAVTVFLPLFTAVITTLMWMTVTLKTKEWIYVKQQNILTVVVIFFVIYPKMVNSTFSPFNCLEVLPGELWMRRDMSILCWESKHALYALALALPGIGVWVIATPLLVLVRLYHLRDRLHTPSVKLRFGFLYMGYLPEFFFWEFVILARKIAVLSVLSFTTSSSIQVQALTVLIVLLLALLLQLRFQPFLSSELNQLEFKSILTCAVTLICGLYYLASGLNVWLQLFLLVLIIAANSYFIVTWAKCLLVIYAVQVVHYCPTCFSRICLWCPPLRSLLPIATPRIFPNKEEKYDPEADDLSSADLSNSHRDRSKVVPDPVTFNVPEVSVPPTPPENTPLHPD